uniref:Uncharacterized protein n=1 Tax=Romanomermis culicivorax TaxID=13658 RepID=A0A915J0I1_ROMCU
MSTLICSLAQWLIGCNAFYPHIVNFMRDWWQPGVIVLEAVTNSQFVHRRNGEVEKFNDQVGTLRAVSSFGCIVHLKTLTSRKPLGTVPKQKD